MSYFDFHSCTTEITERGVQGRAQRAEERAKTISEREGNKQRDTERGKTGAKSTGLNVPSRDR